MLNVKKVSEQNGKVSIEIDMPNEDTAITFNLPNGRVVELISDGQDSSGDGWSLWIRPRDGKRFVCSNFDSRFLPAKADDNRPSVFPEAKDVLITLK